MSDNITLPGTSAVVATDDVGGVQYQVVKLDLGGNGASSPVSTSVPVSGTFWQATQPVSLASQPLPTGAATETTLAAILADIASPVSAVPDNLAPANPVRMVGEDIWTCSFSNVGSSILAPEFNTPIVGTGVGYSQATGNLLITTGTSTNAEFLARSVQAWRGALRMRASTVLSQRIVNQNFAVILGDLIGEGLSCTINSATSITVTKTAHGFTAQNVGQFMFVGGIVGAAGVPGRYAIASVPTADTINFTVAGWPASGSCTLTLFGHSHVKTLFQGTTATNAAWDTQRRGWATGDTTLTINTTASPGTIIQNELDGRACYVADTLRASTATPNVTVRGSRIENIPDDNLDLYAFIWSYNGTTAPATTTTWTISFMCVEKYANIPVYIQGQRAQGGANAAPVAIVGTPAISGTVTASNTAGTAAHSAAASGNPVQVGGVVATAVSTAEVAGDVCRLAMTTGGQQLMKPYGLPETDWQYAAASGGIVNTTDVVAKAAGAASVRNYVTGLSLSNNSATATEFVIKDGATVIWRGHCPANMPNMYYAFPTPLRGTAATAINIACITTAAAVYANLQGYQAP